MNEESVGVLIELDQETDGTLVLDLIKSYRAELPGRMASIQTFFESQEAAKLAFAAHALKSTFANFGATSLSNVLQRIELSAKASDWVSVTAAFSEVPVLLNDFNLDIDDLDKRATEIQKARNKAA